MRTLATTLLSAAPTIALTGLLAVGCGDGDETTADQGAAGRGSTTRSTPTPSAPTTGPAGRRAGEPVRDREDRMDVRVRIGDQVFGATLRDSRAARDLVAQLPVTVEMTDHGGVEKTGPLPHSLSAEGQPGGADPDVGDVGYYAPGNDLVLYYGNQSYFPGIVVLGRMDDGAADQIAAVGGPVTATVEAW